MTDLRSGLIEVLRVYHDNIVEFDWKGGEARDYHKIMEKYENQALDSILSLFEKAVDEEEIKEIVLKFCYMDDYGNWQLYENTTGKEIAVAIKQHILGNLNRKEW